MIIKERGEVFALEYGVPFLETSARMDENIEQAFTILADSILNKVLDVPNENEDYSAKRKSKMHDAIYKDTATTIFNSIKTIMSS